MIKIYAVILCIIRIVATRTNENELVDFLWVGIKPIIVEYPIR